ncbi:hypothetical protein I4U23_027105 [Adineta vaga]|nr:hypothetical protein I4U23_027105 [Adineta vaga]
MDEPLIKQGSNYKLQLRYKKEIFLVIISATIGAAVSPLFFKTPFKSNLTCSYKSSMINDNIKTMSFSKEHIFYNEIAISYLQQNRNQYFSKFTCTGDENDYGAWKERLCVFYNVCYNKDDNRFDYFRLPHSTPKPLFYDSSEGMLFQFGINGKPSPFVTLTVGGDTPWSPYITDETYPTKNFTKLKQIHSLIETRFAFDNIGHGLWEDFGSISYSMDRLNIKDRKLIIMHYNKIDNTSLFRTYYKYVIPALTENPIVQFETYVKSFKTNYVCFDTLVLGGQMHVFPKPEMKEYHGREIIYYNWRSKMIQYNGFDPNFVPKRHHITITNKSDSITNNSGAKRHRGIANLEEVEKFVRDTYPKISTEVIEWHTVEFNHQIEKLLNTTILITPCGGVSMIIPLLPHGAHAIVMDYYVTKSIHGYVYGESASMEGAFLNHIPHVRKQYYQIYGPQDYEFDYPEASDTREAASIIINMPRLQLLIDKAIEEMEF